MNHLIHNRSCTQYVRTDRRCVCVVCKYVCIYECMCTVTIERQYTSERWKGSRGEREMGESAEVYLYTQTHIHFQFFHTMTPRQPCVIYSYTRCYFIPYSFILTLMGMTVLRFYIFLYLFECVFMFCSFGHIRLEFTRNGNFT